MSEFKSCDKCKYDSRGMEEYPCCKCTHNGAADFYAPKTNADRIRSMSDEELADYIFGVAVHEKPCVLCSDYCDFCELTGEECRNKTLQWLQSEVEVDKLD